MMQLFFIIPAVFLLACGSKIYPSEIGDAEALTKSKLSLSAEKLAPTHWKKGQDALELSRLLAKKGKSEESKLSALQSLIHFKTAVAISEGKIAEERIRQAKEDAEKYRSEKEKFSTLRQDAEIRFLKIMAYHMEQKDDAFLRQSNYEKQLEKYLELSKDEKEKWDKAKRPALEKSLDYARSLLEVANLVAAGKADLKAQQSEAADAITAAANAMDSSWDTARPLLDEALMKAERLLEHHRIMAKPQPLENPAASEEILQMVKKNLEGKKLFISATFKGILISIENPWDGKKAQLKEGAAALLDDVMGIVKERAGALVFIEAYYFEKDKEKSQLNSEAIALTAQSFLQDKKFADERVAAMGWGNAPAHDPGPCLTNACPDGRLDIIIVNY